MFTERQQKLPGFKIEKEEIENRTGYRFVRSEVIERNGRYLRALIRSIARKNCWQLDEEPEEETP